MAQQQPFKIFQYEHQLQLVLQTKSPFSCRGSNDLLPTLLLLFLTANYWKYDVNSCNLQKYVFFQIVKGDLN
ncbi:hypothetical protein B8W99_13585 [Peribacillus simplex]|nr:hypothetical protein B8W99_13585 [Peribacillus simplex]